jgi:hypothetical protein
MNNDCLNNARLFATTLLSNKRTLRRLAKNVDSGDGPSLEYVKGVCSEAHNRFYGAKDFFNKEIILAST